MDLIDRQNVVSKYVAVLDVLPIAAYLTNAAGRVSYLNAEWHRITGVPKEHGYDFDVESETPYDLRIHPDDERRVLHYWNAASKGGTAYRDELRLRYADGAYRWVVTETNPLVDERGSFGWIGTLTEIDDIRNTMRSLAASEERYRLLTEALPGSTWTATPDGSAVTITDGRVEFANALRERTRDTWTVGIHPADRERLETTWRTSIANGEPFEMEYRIETVDGSYRWQFCRALPQRDRDQRIVRWVGVTVDVEDRVRLEEQIRQFVAKAGHELRTPLTVISGYIDMLRRGPIDDVTLRDRTFAALTLETKRMRSLVEQLMTLARLDRMDEGEAQILDAGALARAEIAARADAYAAHVSCDAAPDLLVLGEPGDFRAALASLLDNAIKYGRDSDVAVSVRRAGGYVETRVRDGGPGVPRADRARIFERFYRGAEVGDVVGSGLGLAIATTAARRLSGRIELEDARAGATTFLFAVPALEGVETVRTS